METVLCLHYCTFDLQRIGNAQGLKQSLFGDNSPGRGSDSMTHKSYRFFRLHVSNVIFYHF